MSFSNTILIIAEVVMVNVQVDRVCGLGRRDLKTASGYLDAESTRVSRSLPRHVWRL